MSTTPHRSPEPWDDVLGVSASDGAAPPDHDSLRPSDPDPDATEWGASHSGHPNAGGHVDQHETPWHAEPAADEEWYDDQAQLVTLDLGTLYSSGPGVPARGVVIMSGAATGGCALLDFALTGGVNFFFDLCFVVICLAAAMAAAPRALFTVGVMPPLVFAAMIAAVSLVEPETITTGGFTTVFLTGLADHAVPLCIAYAVALVVASARGLAYRGASRR